VGWSRYALMISAALPVCSSTVGASTRQPKVALGHASTRVLALSRSMRSSATASPWGVDLILPLLMCHLLAAHPRRAAPSILRYGGLRIGLTHKTPAGSLRQRLDEGLGLSLCARRRAHAA
jgi:hypothetical protein